MYIYFHLKNLSFHFKNCIDLKEVVKMYKDVSFHLKN